MRRALLLIAAIVLVTLQACDSNVLGPDPACPEPARNDSRVSIAQGIWGDVWFWNGDFMPGPECPSGTITPVEREILVHEPTTLDRVTRGPSPGFFGAIDTKLVASARSDGTGFFEIDLPPGTYSLFVREDGLFYAATEGAGGVIFPVEVEAGRVTEVRFDITYEATY